MYHRVANGIFDYGLRPNALKIYVYLTTLPFHGDTVRVSYSKMAERCAMSRQTALTATAELQDKGLIKKVSNRHDRSVVSNSYVIQRITGSWFKLPQNALKLPKGAFSVYAFLCRCSRNGKAFPSFRLIAQATAMGVQAVRNAVAKLHELRLVALGAYLSGCHNLYWLENKQEQPDQTGVDIGADETKVIYGAVALIQPITDVFAIQTRRILNRFVAVLRRGLDQLFKVGLSPPLAMMEV